MPNPLERRLNSLTTAEAACCLSLNQASSIQNLGVTCAAITLPTNRLSFISEVLADGDEAVDVPEPLRSTVSVRTGA
jgi:hypothetical protein